MWTGIRRSIVMIRWAAPVFFLALPASGAEGGSAGSAGRGTSIAPGAYEAGLGASFLSVEGSTRADLGLRGARFCSAPRGLIAVGAELTYGHISSLDEFGLEGSAGWSPAGSREGIFPFAGIAAGVRREWIGSFNQARYPVGATVGVRALFSKRSAVRFEYRFRRVLSDPIADFTEHRIVAGVSLFWRNG